MRPRLSYCNPFEFVECLEARVHLAAQAYDWNNVTIKGTGFVNGIVFSPAAPNVVYANTDMGGAYRWDQSSAKWQPLNDWAQSTDWSVNYLGAESIAVDPTDGNRVYMSLGTYMGTSAILRSTDQGRTWQRTNVSFPMNGNGNGRNAGQRMMVDPNSPNILFYGSRNQGIWKSADYGATWNKQTNFTFTSDASGATQDVGVTWIVIDKSSSTAGSPSSVIYAGAATTGANKIFRSVDGGATWAAMTGQPTGATTYPVRGALTPDGSLLYLTYTVDDVGPNGASNGYVYKVAAPKLTPAFNLLTIDSPHGQGGWSGVTIDPSTPSTVYVSTIDRWWPAPYDQIYRSTNSGANWTALNPGNHRNDSSSGWSSGQNIHWLGDVQVDPFNPNHVMFTTGYGIYNSTSASAAAPTWTFFNDGLEQSAALELSSPNTGSVHLISAIGDRDGFRHADFNISPASLGQNSGMARGTNVDIDTAGNDAHYVVRLTQVSPYVQYSNDNGITWNWMPSTGVSGGNNGNLAISADGTKIAYEPDGTGQLIYSTRTGTTWSNWATPATNGPADGAKIVADLVDPQTFFAISGNNIYRSTDGGVNWTLRATSSNVAGLSWIRAVPGQAGHLLISRGSTGLWRSTNGGTSWSRINASAVTTAYQVGVGAAAPTASYPSIYVGGVVSGQPGFFRSDDQGATWTMISDLSHNFGAVTVIQGDPRVYGRLYVGANGRGILYGDVHPKLSNLPSGWNTIDIGSVANAGSAGESSGAWELTGSGAGITGNSDQFRFAYKSLSGDGTIIAQVTGLSLASPANSSAKAGVMIRSTLSSDSQNAFVALTPGSVNGAMFQTRSGTGGATSSANITSGVWPPYWVKLTRIGNVFTAYYSPDGANWSQLGSPASIAMGQNVYIGLATTSSDNNQVNIAKFANVNVITDFTPPTILTAEYLWDTAANQIAVSFSEDVAASIGIEDMFVTRNDNSNIAVTGFAYDAGTNTAIFTLALPMLDGNYTATILSSSIKDTAQNALAADYPFSFFALAGDADRSRRVDTSDFNLLAHSFGSNGNTFAQGDFNYDTQVDAVDFNMLLSQYGKSLPAPAGVLSIASGELFSTGPIRRTDRLAELA